MEGVLQAQSRWPGQYNILKRGTGTYPCIPSSLFLTSSFIDPFSSLFLSLFHISPSFPPHPPPPPPPPLTVILWYSFLPFMSVSAHSAPGRQWIKSSDRQVLVLLLVLSEMARCRAPASVWCSLHQHTTLKSKTDGKKDRQILPLSSSTLPNNHFYGCITLMCVGYICEWMTECVRVCVCLCVKGFLYVSARHQGSQGKMTHPPTSCQTLGPFSWIIAAPNPLQSLCKYCSLWHVYRDKSGCVHAVDASEFMHGHTWQLMSINSHTSLSGRRVCY